MTEVVKAFAERSDTLKDMAQAAFSCISEFEEYDPKAAGKNLTAAAEATLRKVQEALAALPEWRAAPIHEAVKGVAGRADWRWAKSRSRCGWRYPVRRYRRPLT